MLNGTIIFSDGLSESKFDLKGDKMDKTNTQCESPKIVHRPGYLKIEDSVCEAKQITYIVENMKKVDTPPNTRMLSND